METNRTDWLIPAPRIVCDNRVTMPIRDDVAPWRDATPARTAELPPVGRPARNRKARRRMARASRRANR